MDAYSELVRLIKPLAAQAGCIVEIDDRRGLGVVGISVRVDLDAVNPRPGELGWLDELDGLTFEEALAYCRSSRSHRLI